MNDLKRSNTVSWGIPPDMPFNGISEARLFSDAWTETWGESPTFFSRAASFNATNLLNQHHYKHYQLVYPYALNVYIQKERFLSLSSLNPDKKQQPSSGMLPDVSWCDQNRERPCIWRSSYICVKLSCFQPFSFCYTIKWEGSWILDQNNEVLLTHPRRWKLI